jgi:type III secretion protein V
LVAGLLIGVFQKGMELPQALRTYLLLTIGEGLVAQIPALVISTAAGIIVTRVSSEEGGHLGIDIGKQVISQPKAIAIAACLLFSLALVPGLPALPFVILAALLGIFSYQAMKTRARLDDQTMSSSAFISPAPLLSAITIDLSPSLAEVMLASKGSRFVSELLPGLRERFFKESGIVIPIVQVNEDAGHLLEGTYVIRLHEVPIAHGKIPIEGVLVRETIERLRTLGVDAEEIPLPDGSNSVRILPPDMQAIYDHGMTILSPEEIIVEHLLTILRYHGYRLVGIQETQALLDGLAQTHPSLIREVVPRLVTHVQLADILQLIAREGISLRNLGEILSTLAKLAPLGGDSSALVEKVREALQRQITFKYLASDGFLHVFLIDDTIEETLREAIRATGTGSYLALEPEISDDIVQAVTKAVVGFSAPVVLASGDIRRHLRKLFESEYPAIAVIAHRELMPETQIRTIGRIKVEHPLQS